MVCPQRASAPRWAILRRSSAVRRSARAVPPLLARVLGAAGRLPGDSSFAMSAILRKAMLAASKHSLAQLERLLWPGLFPLLRCGLWGPGAVSGQACLLSK